MTAVEPRLPDPLTPRDTTPKPSLWRVWFGLTEEVPRGVYATSGFLLMFLKYCVEATATFIWTDRVLTPLEFTLFWSKHVPKPWEIIRPTVAEQVPVLAYTPGWLGWLILAWTLPFIWVAFSMSFRRASNAGATPWVGALILVPLVNIAVMLLLAAAPERRTRRKWDLSPATSNTPDKEPRRVARAIVATLAGVLLGLGSIGLGVYGWNQYGVTLFFGAPVLMGCLSGFVYNYRQSQSWITTIGVSLLMILVTGSSLLVFALEGIICLLMAAPLVMPLAVFGALLGKAVACATQTTVPQTVGMLMVLPIMSTVESLPPSQSPEYVVTSSVEVNAPPETVWKYVVEFPDLPEPEDWFFRVGIACPIRARIDGHGVGATRYCEFTTGAFVEPITTWDAPRHLAFDVTSQPDPMRELSPYSHVHPPHMENQSLKSLRGEFRLVPLPGGRTRLEGSTWYTFDMFPRDYWTTWSDVSIHKIHNRVLGHIKRLSESKAVR